MIAYLGKSKLIMILLLNLSMSLLNPVFSIIPVISLDTYLQKTDEKPSEKGKTRWTFFRKQAQIRYVLEMT